MTYDELQVWRKAAGERIDPSTAEVWFQYGRILDPYGDELSLPPEGDAVGRVFFAADPVEKIAVCFWDLPETTCDQLYAKRMRADREGWLELLRPASRLNESAPGSEA